MTKYANTLIPGLLGLCAYLIIVGMGPLDPQNLAWLGTLNADQIMHYLGWAFYRESPWTSPLGMMSNYGLDIGTIGAIGTTTVYTDSIPLVAALFKLFRSTLPSSFQYFGLWLLACFVLQAIFAWKLSRLITPSRLAGIFICCLFVFSPILIWRLVHASHVAHFLILAAILLLFKPSAKWSSAGWVLLLCLATVINFYIFVMLLGLWICHSMDCLFFKKSTQPKEFYLSTIILCLLLPLCMWQAGYFVNLAQGASAQGHFGMYQMNLLAPITPKGWSYLLPEIEGVPIAYGNWVNNSAENFMYLGAGNILMLCASIILTFKNKGKDLCSTIKNNRLLTGLCCAFLIFSLSNNIQIGAHEFRLNLPGPLSQLFSIFRSSARFFWPIYYLLILWAILISAKKLTHKNFLFLLAFCALLQIMDTSAGWLAQREKINKVADSEFITPLVSPFWGVAAKNYEQLITMPVRNLPSLWPTLAQYAAKNKLSTNITYISRDSQSHITKINQQLNLLLLQQEFNHQFFVFDQEDLLIPFKLGTRKGIDLFSKIDGVYVFAPNWYQCAPCSALKLNPIEIDFDRSVTYPVSFGKDQLGAKFLVAPGWQGPESWGTWSNGNLSTIVLPLPKDVREDLKIVLELLPLVSPSHPIQSIEIAVNGSAYRKFDLSHPDKITLNIPGAYSEYRHALVQFHLPTANTPKAMGVNEHDDRPIAIGLISAYFTP